MPYDKKPGAAVRMYDKKGKPAGLMLEGSMAYMESISQEKSNLMQDMPIDNRGISQMSPYKMDDPDPKKKAEQKKAEQLTNKQKFQAAGAALGEDVSFTLKTFEDDGQSFDPRSGRYINEVKSKLKNKKPEVYKDLYGK
jgi:hypothetical protein